MKTLAFLIQKGGVGKTSLCHHLAGALVALGRRILLVDADPQASLTQGIFGPQAAEDLPRDLTIAGVLAGDKIPPEGAIFPTPFAGISILAGSWSATDQNTPTPWLAPEARQFALRRFLGEVRGYDLCLIDCPPNLNFCSWAALLAADSLIVPVQPEDYGSQGIALVLGFLALVRVKPNPFVSLGGFVVNMIDHRAALPRLYEAELRELYGDQVFEATIPRSVDFAEAIYRRRPVQLHRPRGKAAEATRGLAAEVLARIGMGPTIAAEAEGDASNA